MLDLDAIELRALREFGDQCLATFCLPGPLSNSDARAIHGVPGKDGLVSELAKSGQLVESFVSYPKLYETLGTDGPRAWWFTLEIPPPTYRALTKNQPGTYQFTKSLSYRVPTPVTKATTPMPDLSPQQLFDLSSKATADGNRELANHYYNAYREASRYADIAKVAPEATEQTVAQYVHEVIKSKAELESLLPRHQGKSQLDLELELYDSTTEGRLLYQLQSSEYGSLPVSALMSRVAKSKGDLLGVERAMQVLSDWDSMLSE